MSDIHLEFGMYEPVNENGADVLVLAGDICVLDALKRQMIDPLDYSEIRDFFETASYQYKNIIYVMGNHEHYHGDMTESVRCFRDIFGYLKNVHLLDNSNITIDDVTFIGSTLWTNFDNNKTALVYISNMMNDYKCIDYGDELFTSKRSVQLHMETMEYFNSVISDFDKVVMVTHHSPSFKNIGKRFSRSGNNNIINLAYHSDLDHFILGNPQIKTWISGHTHDPFDHYLGDTRLVCNPRGYFGYEKISINYKPKTIEL